MGYPRHIVAVALASAAAASGISGCSEVMSGSSTADDAATSDATALDARRPLPDAEDVSCDAGDASSVTPPAPYANRSNPLGADESAASAGGQTFAVRCVFCHGPGGKGDGPEGPKDPPPANLTATRLDDAYLLWRISTGGRGDPFCSAMPAFSAILTERQRWELVAFVQTLAPKADGGVDASGE